MKIDIYSHIMPPKYLAAFEKLVSPQICKQLSYQSLPPLWNIEARINLIRNYEGLVEILTLSNPAVELVGEPSVSIELSRIANDEMAELVARYPDYFVGAVACLPMNDMDAALREAERSINDLGMKGVQIYSSVRDKPLDSPEFMPLYEKMAKYDLPVWIHPIFQVNRGPTVEDAASIMERVAFGMSSGTPPAMTRLVFSRVFDRSPGIKFITHHCGAGVPLFFGRIKMQYEMNKAKSPYQEFKRPVPDYYKMFYADTALHTNLAALMCGYDFFGADHILFGTDMPYGPEAGAWSIRETIGPVERMNIGASEKKKIFEDNAKKILRLSIP